MMHFRSSYVTSNSARLISRRLLAVRGRRRRCFALVLFRKQTKLIDAGRSNLIDNCDNIAVLRSSIALHVDGLVEAVGNAILDLAGQVIFTGRRMSQVDGAT